MLLDIFALDKVGMYVRTYHMYLPTYLPTYPIGRNNGPKRYHPPSEQVSERAHHPLDACYDSLGCG